MKYTVFISTNNVFDDDCFVRFDNVTRKEVDILAEIISRNNCDMLIRPVKKGK